jgi:hypothetical protein
VPDGWVFLRVSGVFEMAVPQSRIYRVLHRRNADYHTFAPSALALHRQLGLEADPSQPGVLVVLRSGACWYVGDASYGGDAAHLAYCSVPPDLFSGAAPWCRGVLHGPGRLVYVISEEYLEAGAA